MKQDNDWDLIRRVVAGDRQAEDALYSAFAPTVEHAARSVLEDKSEVPDVTNEVLHKVFRSLEGFEGKSSLRWWIRTIAVRHCINVNSARRRLRAVEESLGSVTVDEYDHLLGSIPSLRLTPAGAVLNTECGVKVEEALNRLPPDMRAVTRASLLDQTESEISRETGHSVPRVRGLVHRGIQKVRIALTKSGYGRGTSFRDNEGTVRLAISKPQGEGRPR